MRNLKENEDKNRNWLNLRLGRYFKEARLKADFSQSDAAEKLGCSLQYISNLENGRAGISPSQIRRFVVLYDIDETQYVEEILEIQNEYLSAELEGRILKVK